jgi:hypothetical protein
LEELRAESSILDFEPHLTIEGLPEAYVLRFRGKGAWRPTGAADIALREHHEVSVRLGANYPRMMPELSWKTPIFHPNISGSGFVCLGGYGTFWAPSLNLDELCVMLWDMVRYQNYDVNSPYNREAALWAKTQRNYKLPLDARPLRDLRANGIREIRACHPSQKIPSPPQPEIVFLDDVVEAEVIAQAPREVLIIE